MRHILISQGFLPYCSTPRSQEELIMEELALGLPVRN